MNKKFIFSPFLFLGFVSLAISAESELQIRMKTLQIGDTKEKVVAIMGSPTTQEINQWPGLTCEQLVFKKTLAQVPPQVEEATLTLCVNRLVAQKYVVRPLVNL